MLRCKQAYWKLNLGKVDIALFILKPCEMEMNIYDLSIYVIEACKLTLSSKYILYKYTG